MVKVKILRNYGSVVEGEIREVSPQQLDYLLSNGIAEKVNCGSDCEECEDCKSTKKKRTVKNPIQKTAVTEDQDKPKKVVRKRTVKSTKK